MYVAHSTSILSFLLYIKSIKNKRSGNKASDENKQIDFLRTDRKTDKIIVADDNHASLPLFLALADVVQS